MANQEILAVIYGLASASLWGTSNFTGGFVTKTNSVFGVILIANITGTVLLTICALWVESPIPDTYSLMFGAFAGIAGLIGLAAFYKGLAIDHSQNKFHFSPPFLLNRQSPQKLLSLHALHILLLSKAFAAISNISTIALVIGIFIAQAIRLSAPLCV